RQIPWRDCACARRRTAGRGSPAPSLRIRVRSHSHEQQEGRRRDDRLPDQSTTPSQIHPSTGRFSEVIRTRRACRSRPGSPLAMTLSPTFSDVRVTGYFDAESWLLDPHSSVHVSVVPSFAATSIFT